MRELLRLRFLVALGDRDPQVKGQDMVSQYVGNDRALLIDVVTLPLSFIGYMALFRCEALA